jgi:hypothetical protein
MSIFDFLKIVSKKGILSIFIKLCNNIFLTSNGEIIREPIINCLHKGFCEIINEKDLDAFSVTIL